LYNSQKENGCNGGAEARVEAPLELWRKNL